MSDLKAFALMSLAAVVGVIGGGLVLYGILKVMGA